MRGLTLLEIYYGVRKMIRKKKRFKIILAVIAIIGIIVAIGA